MAQNKMNIGIITPGNNSFMNHGSEQVRHSIILNCFQRYEFSSEFLFSHSRDSILVFDLIKYKKRYGLSQGKN